MATLATRRCSRCGSTGHNARTCRAPNGREAHEAERTLRLLLPAWIAVAHRYQHAQEAVESLVTPELRAAWTEQSAAMQASNEVATTCDALMRKLPEDRREALYAALRDGFGRYNEVLNEDPS